MNARKFAAGAAALAIGIAGLASCSRKSANAPVQIGFEKGYLCSAPVHMAITLGFLEEEFSKIGQEYVLVDMLAGGSTQAELVASGKLDAAYNLTATLMQPIDNGLPVSFITGVHTGCTRFYARADSGITSPADLRGKKIGVISLADSSVISLKRKLDDLGFVVEGPDAEFELLVYSSEDLPIALNKGALDAIALHDPISVIAEQQYGFTKILDTASDEKFANEYCCQAYVTRKLLKENPKAAAAYARAIQKGAAFAQANPRETARLQIENDLVPGDLDFNAGILEGYNFTPSISLGKKSFTDAAVQLKKFGTLKASTDVQKFLADTYAVLDGVPEGYDYDVASGSFTEVTKPREHL